MAFAFGFAQAEDHLEHILLAYRVANGRASEIYGERFVESDTFARIMRHADLASNAYDTLDATTRDLCEGFALGINSRMIERPDKSPAWAEPVRPVDVLAFFHHYLMTMAPFDYPGIYHPPKGTPIANAWALAPSRTKEGKSILVMNPHTDYDGIFQWYEAHLSTRDLNVYGATLYGLPVIMMGHNETLGWALSPNDPDIADIFSVTTPPRNQNTPAPNVVRQASNTRQQFTPSLFTSESDTQSYYVWNNNHLSQRQTERYMTRKGPVIAFDQGLPYAFQVGGYRDFGGLRQLFDMGRAQNLDRFRKVWNRQQLPLFHAVYTDRSGNLFYSYNAKVGNKSYLQENREFVPRLSKTLWESPVSTETPGAYWGSTLAPDQLPWLINPESGYIQASGTPPWLVTEGTQWSRYDWADWLVRDPDSYRAKRLRQLFQYGKLSFEDNQSILYDTIVPLAVETVPYLYNAARANQDYVYRSHPDLQVVLNILKDWDFQARPDSIAMTFFHVWWTLFSREYEHRATASEALHAMLQQDTPEMQRYLLSTAANAARMMRDYYQTVQIPWGQVHRIRRGASETPIAGSYTGEPIFGMGDSYFDNGKWIAKQGPGFTMAVQFGDVPKAVSYVPFGTSEDPDSDHYSDQTALMVERRFKHTRYTRADVEGHSVKAIGKTIAFRPANSGTAVVMRAPVPVRMRLGLSHTLDVTLPPNLAAYSPYLEPVVEPANIQIETTLEFHVPESLCSLKTLNQLVVYSYSPGAGWNRIPEQELNGNIRTFYARGYGRQVFAVLGPRTGLIGILASEKYDSFEPDLAHLASPSPATTRSLPQPEFNTPHLSALEQERIARNYPTIPPEVHQEPKTSNRQRAENVRNLSFPNINGHPIPAIPPGWKEFFENPPMLQIPHRTSAPPSLLPPPMLRRQTPIPRKDAKHDNEESQSLPSPKEIPILDSAENQSKRVQNANSPQEESLPTPVTVEDLPVPAQEAIKKFAPDAIATEMIKRHREAKAPQGPENPFRKGQGVLWRSGLPKEMNRLTANRSPESLVLASNPELATKLGFGKNIRFPLPLFNATFEISTKSTVRAQIEFMPIPPEAFPGELIPFSATFNIRYKDRSVPGSVAGTIRISRKVCSPENFNQLNLYAYDPENGWLELSGIRRSANNMTFTFLDRYIRTYAILGPAAIQLAPPQTRP
jgi:acyl-homoserine-lactone acylase